MNKCVYKFIYAHNTSYYTIYIICSISLVGLYKIGAINAVCCLVSGSKKVCRG